MTRARATALLSALAVMLAFVPTSASARAAGHSGRTLLFVPSFSSNVISVYDATTERLVKHIGIDAQGACCAYVSPDKKDLYVVDGLSPYVTQINIRTLSVTRVISIPGTWGDRGSPLPTDGKMFWLDSIPQGDIEWISTQSHQVVKHFPGAGEQFQNSRDGRWLFIADKGFFVVRSTTTGKIAAKIPYPNGGGTIAKVSPDGSTVYMVGDSVSSSIPLDEVSYSYIDIFDVRSPTHPHYVKSLKVGGVSLDARFTPDHRQMWVANAGAGTISVIDLSSNSVVQTINVGRYVCGLGFYGNRAYVVQSPLPLPTNYAVGVAIGIADVIPGAATAPPSGSNTWRPGIDAPGEMVVYNRSTYQRMSNIPPVQLPSESFGLETVTLP